MRALNDNEWLNFRSSVKCQWLTCFAGMGLAGIGSCCVPAGRWDRKKCPAFKTAAEFEAEMKERADLCSNLPF